MRRPPVRGRRRPRPPGACEEHRPGRRQREPPRPNSPYASPVPSRALSRKLPAPVFSREEEGGRKARARGGAWACTGRGSGRAGEPGSWRVNEWAEWMREEEGPALGGRGECRLGDGLQASGLASGRCPRLPRRAHACRCLQFPGKFAAVGKETFRSLVYRPRDAVNSLIVISPGCSAELKKINNPPVQATP